MARSTFTTGNFLLGAAIACGLIISSLLVTDTIKYVKRSTQTINVKGYAEKTIKSNLGVWQIALSSFSSDKLSAYQNLESDINTTMEYLKTKGINGNDIRKEAVNAFPNFRLNENGNQTNELLGYTLSMNLVVTSKNVDLIDKLSRSSTELIKKGVNFNSMNPSFYYTKLDDLKIKMLMIAAKDARMRAEKLAESNDCRIDRLITARQGVFQLTSEYSSETSDDGYYDLGSINKTIKAVVTMEYTFD
ncbi:MAG: SIMPL domain-containing protein [bacterium]